MPDKSKASSLKGPLMLLATAVLWGLAFVAQTTASSNIEPFTFNASRNFVGALFLTGVIAVRKRQGHDVAPLRKSEDTEKRGEADGCTSPIDGRSRPIDERVSCSERSARAAQGSSKQLGRYTTRALMIGGAACGIVLCIASFLQQSGIGAYPANAAASGRSGFVTATYMIMVALYTVFAGKKSHPLVFASVVVAIVGMYFLCVPNGIENIYWGDMLVFGSAVGYAAHIIVIDRFTAVDGVRLSRVQLLVAGSISLVCALMLEHPSIAGIACAIVPILYAGILSDGVAYTLQIVAQKTTDPTVASIIMSLESVFAALGGWIILGERLGAVELLGCTLVFAAVMLSQVPTFIENVRKKQEPGK